MTPIDLTTLELSPEQVAQQTGSTSDRVRRLAAAGKLPGARNVGNGSRAHWVVPASQLDEAQAALAEAQGRRTVASVTQELRDFLQQPYGIQSAAEAHGYTNGLLDALAILEDGEPRRWAQPVGDSFPDPYPKTPEEAFQSPDDEIPHHELDTHFANAVADQ